MENNNSTTSATPAKKPVNRFLTRLAVYYSQFAVLFLNTVLLLGIALLITQFFLDSRSSLAKPLPVYSQYFNLDSYVLTDHETALQVGLEFDRMGEQESYEYHPWTVFMERRFDGKVVTVEEHFNHNARGTKPPAPLQEGQEDLLVWTFGGSTMFGWGLPDDQTIDSHLQN
ncbi:MAG: hypothetical protein HYR94_10165, partial [Chloroflexi bacterium]|nr:hypothetical protein [Chloroflexota bacterium]